MTDPVWPAGQDAMRDSLVGVQTGAVEATPQDEQLQLGLVVPSRHITRPPEPQELEMPPWLEQHPGQAAQAVKGPIDMAIRSMKQLAAIRRCAKARKWWVSKANGAGRKSIRPVCRRGPPRVKHGCRLPSGEEGPLRHGVTPA